MRARRRKSDFKHVVRAAPGVERGAAAARAMRVDQFANRCVEPRLPQRLDDEPAFPGSVCRSIPMLNRTAAADPEMPAKWLDASLARMLDPEQSPPVGMAGYGRELDALVG